MRTAREMPKLQQDCERMGGTTTSSRPFWGGGGKNAGCQQTSSSLHTCMLLQGKATGVTIGKGPNSFNIRQVEPIVCLNTVQPLLLVLSVPNFRARPLSSSTLQPNEFHNLILSQLRRAEHIQKHNNKQMLVALKLSRPPGLFGNPWKPKRRTLCPLRPFQICFKEIQTWITCIFRKQCAELSPHPN